MGCTLSTDTLKSNDYSNSKKVEEPKSEFQTKDKSDISSPNTVSERSLEQKKNDEVIKEDEVLSIPLSDNIDVIPSKTKDKQLSHLPVKSISKKKPHRVSSKAMEKIAEVSEEDSVSRTSPRQLLVSMGYNIQTESMEELEQENIVKQLVMPYTSKKKLKKLSTKNMETSTKRGNTIDININSDEIPIGNLLYNVEHTNIIIY